MHANMQSFGLTVLLLATEVMHKIFAMDTQPQWVMLQEQHDNKDKSRPEHRYSHSASPMGDVMVVTHGYYYGHGGSGPQWLDDTWIFDPAINLWTQAISPTRLLLFGGDDGGHLRGSRGYELSHLNDLWMLDSVAGVWECVDQGGPATPQRPAPRAHHAAVLLSDRVSMLVVGGIHYDDVWVYNTKLNVWSEISMGTLEADGLTPGKRHGCAIAVDVAGTGAYVFGGYRFNTDISHAREHKGALDDLWHLNVHDRQWSLLSPAHPTGGRTYASMNLLAFTTPAENADSVAAVSNELALFAGANCEGSCVCFGDVWRYRVNADGSRNENTVWEKQAVEAEPITRYKQTVVVINHTLYSFGGESYQPYMYHNGVMQLALGADGTGMSPLSRPPWTIDWALFSVSIVGVLVAYRTISGLRQKRAPGELGDLYTKLR